MLNIIKGKEFKFILVFCIGIFSTLQMCGCASIKLGLTIVNDNMMQSPEKGYTKFKFTTSKTTGEAAFDVATNIALAALGGSADTDYYLQIYKVSNEIETPIFQIRSYDIENGGEDTDWTSRWDAELPGKHTYRVKLINGVFFPTDRIVFGDVTVEVKENQITPVEIYFMDFYNYYGKSKKEDTTQQDDIGSPNLDMGAEQTMKEERFYVGEPYPVANEQNEDFIENIKN